jgi:alkanesulfonate monooxygenase SsuD/methylene tetrahydromethanopterin reductase-like flavin-dependent oxidoreductase (luciferase family)
MGGNFEHRWGQTREAVLAMKQLWTKTRAEFHGKFYDFPPVYSFPRPVQKPHPPVILGGMAPNVLKRVAAWGDGWMPNRVTPEQIKQGRATLDELAEASGRDPASIHISVFGQPPDLDLLRRFVDAGAERVIVRLPTAAEKEALEELEKIGEKVLE